MQVLYTQTRICGVDNIGIYSESALSRFPMNLGMHSQRVIIDYRLGRIEIFLDSSMEWVACVLSVNLLIGIIEEMVHK